jgi:hypothetical protein
LQVAGRFEDVSLRGNDQIIRRVLETQLRLFLTSAFRIILPRSLDITMPRTFPISNLRRYEICGRGPPNKSTTPHTRVAKRFQTSDNIFFKSTRR